MVLNRLQNYAKQRGPPRGLEYFLVRSGRYTLMVSRKTAHSLVKQLRRWLRPNWIRVVDLSGSEIWLPADSIEVVCESTPAQRVYDRKLRKQLDEEENDGEPAWE